MKFKPFRHYLIASIMLLAGCNLFNPSGEGTLTGSEANISGGEELYRQGKYAEAMAAFSKAIGEDSTASLAYYGYAKASVARYDISVLSILRDLDSASKLDSTQSQSVNIPLLNHGRDTLTSRLKGAVQVNIVLDILAKRDSLTRYFNYVRDTASPSLVAKAKLNDTAYARHLDFMTHPVTGYLAKGDANTPGYYRRNQFPLTDMAMPMNRIGTDYGVYKLMRGLNGTYDLNGDGTIDSSEYAFRSKIKLSGEGGGFSNVKSVNSDLADTTTRNGFNNVIQNLGSDLSSSSEILKAFFPAKKDTSDSNGASQNLDSAIQSLGASITFYQFGDKKDNDGDGCIDEEVLDSKDNDLDGYIDEDARIVPSTDTNAYDDFFDNDHNVGIAGIGARVNDKFKEGPAGAVGNTNLNPYPSEPFVLTFVNNYRILYPKSVYPDSDWVKIRKGSAEIDLRIQIQKDSLTLKTSAQLGTGGAFKAKLDEAKRLVGGCWRNY